MNTEVEFMQCILSLRLLDWPMSYKFADVNKLLSLAMQGAINALEFSNIWKKS